MNRMGHEKTFKGGVVHAGGSGKKPKISFRYFEIDF